MLQLATTPNKIAIRQKWDKPIIRMFSENLGHKLNYFGLPGPDIEDFLDWGEYLEWKTAVEFLAKNGIEVQNQKRKINLLQSTVMINGFGNKFDLRRGCLEDIILSGSDNDGNSPAKLIIKQGQPARLEYDLHNWDFQGGLGYRNKNPESKRIEAIKKCISLQKQRAFLFMLTLNVRHTLGEELANYLSGQANELSLAGSQDIFTWYSTQNAATRSEHQKIKAVVTLFVRQVAHVNSFDCYCYPPIYYEGWKEHLIHFVFTLIPKGTILPSFSIQTLDNVIKLPLLTLVNGNIGFADQQYPGFVTQETIDSLFAKLDLDQN